MTNSLAIVLGVMILGAIALDHSFHAGESTLFVLRKLADLVEWLAFWR